MSHKRNTIILDSNQGQRRQTDSILHVHLLDSYMSTNQIDMYLQYRPTNRKVVNKNIMLTFGSELRK